MILLADDEPSVLRLGERVLKSAGFRVLLAKDGHEAIELFRQNADEIDAVILDMGMPGADGVAALEAVRAINPRPAIIIATGLSIHDAEAAFRTQRPNALLQKPYRPAQLIEGVNAILRVKTP
jgi:two-component system, cell cycle sensor histidine kinase and response regulator CckA